MDAFLSYTFSGLTSAAIYGVAAAGLVLTYTTTGTFNFAHGATGMLAAFTYWQLRFAWHLPAPIALVICLLVLAPLFGIFQEVVIMRRLRGAEEYTRLVVTIGMLVGVLGAALWIWDPNTAHPIRTFFDGQIVTVLGVRVTYHKIFSFFIAIGVALALRLFLYRTRIGVAMRASVDDRSLAMLNGARPDRASLLAWAIGASLAALSGVLISPTLQLSAVPLTLLIVNAYAAAMIGRLRSLPWTFGGALILGLADAYSRGYISTNLTAGKQYLEGFYDSIPVIILFVVLLLLPNPRLRGHGTARSREIVTMPRWRGALLFGGVVVAGSAVLVQIVGRSDLETISKVWGIAIIGLSLVPLIGYAGQVSLCQLTFAGIGAIVADHLGRGGSPLALAYAALIAGAVGAVVALPALRLSGIYLALSTAAFAVAMDRWVFPLPKFTLFGHDISLLEGGSLTIHRIHFLGLSFEGQKAYFVLLSVAFVLASLVVVAIRRSRFGFRLLAMKDSPAACATLGLNLTRTKLAVFTISAAMAGVGGALYGGALRVADAQVFAFFTGLPILLIMVVAGIATVGGALACGILLGAPFLTNLFPTLTQLQLVLSGLAGIGMARNPNGFVLDLRRRWNVLETHPMAAVGVAGALVAAWMMRVGHVLDNWTYAVLTLAILALGPQLASANLGYRSWRERGDAVPLEWLGIASPFTPAAVAELDRALALPEFARAEPAWTESARTESARTDDGGTPP